MPKTDDNTAEIIIEHLREMRAQLSGLTEKVEAQGRDVMNVRRELHSFRGDILRFEEKIADIGDDVKVIKKRLNLVDA